MSSKVTVILAAALSTAGCASINDEQTAVAEGCLAIHRQAPHYQIACSDLRASRAGHNQWHISEPAVHNQIGGGIHVVLTSTGRVIRIWADE